MTQLLSPQRTQLLIVDVQERLAPALRESAACVANIILLMRAARELAIPITLSEQYPQGLGPTLHEVLAAGEEAPKVFQKLEFSCGRNDDLRRRVLGLGRDQIVVCGMEAHVCVLQTAFDFCAGGESLFVVADAVASRRETSKDFALRRMERAGVALVTSEMAVFEWLGRAGTPAFKAMAPLLKG